MTWLKSRNWLFLLTLVCLSILKFQFMPLRNSLGLHAEMWAEAATNYFDCAHFSGGFHCYLQTDAGYLAFLPRFLSQLIEAFAVTLPSIPLVQQAFAVLIILLCCASVTLDIFAPLYGGRWSRFLLALVLSHHLDYELHTFINASYFLIVPAASTLALLALSQTVSLPLCFSAAVIVSLAILSKGVFVTLLPMSLLSAGYLGLKKRWKVSVIFAVPVLAAAFLQIGTMVNSMRSAMIVGVNSSAAMDTLIWTSVTTLFHGLASLFFDLGSLKLDASLALVLSVVMFLALISMLVVTIQRLVLSLEGGAKSPDYLIVFWLFFGGAVSAHIIAVGGSLVFRVFPMNQFAAFPLLDRRWFIQAILMLCVSWAFINRYLQVTRFQFIKVAALPALVLLLLFNGYPFKYRADNYQHDYSREYGFSNWSQFSSYFTDQTACAPLNPYPWIYGRSCRILNTPPRLDDFRRTLAQMTDVEIKVPAEFRPGLIFLGFFIWDRAKTDKFVLDVNSNGTTKEISALDASQGPFIFFPISGLPEQQDGQVDIKLRKTDRQPFMIGLPDRENLPSSFIWIGA